MRYIEAMLVETRALSPVELREHSEELADVLLDCIAGGASVSFMADFTRDAALAFWANVARDAETGARVVVAAFGERARLDGTAQLLLTTPPNQPHRAELAKMLVHRRARNLGLGRALFEAIEREARARSRTLLTFDTVSGSPAERLYVRCGCVKVGEIPSYALYPDGTPCATSVFYKLLRGAPSTALQ